MKNCSCTSPRKEENKKQNVVDISNISAITHYPTPLAENAPVLSDEEKIAYIAQRFHEIMEVIGLDLTDDSLAKTPHRIAKMYVKEIFSGLKMENFPDMTFIEDRFQTEDKGNMVLTKANFVSFCEHHFVPIIGVAYVAYVPKGKLIGLSKIPRLVRFFARRPQVQERLTAQIADSLSSVLETEDVAVSLVAQHYCVIARGVEDENSHTVTNVLRGEFQLSEALRQEFFGGVRRRD